MYCDLVNVQPRFTLVSNEIIIKVILNLEEVISVAPYLTDKRLAKAYALKPQK